VFLKTFIKEINTYYDPQFSVMDVLGGFPKLQNIGRNFSEVQP